MKCPNCGNETNITASKKEYIYPRLFLGMPTFWSFMSPAVAKAVTAFILLTLVATVVITVIWIIQGYWFMSLFTIPLIVFTAYNFNICLKSLGKCQIKEYFQCKECGLEWSI